jgi:hypothetical protein
MSKFKVDSSAANGHADPSVAPKAPAAHMAKAAESSSAKDDMVANVATIGVVAVGAALIEVALIPGIVIGVAAAFAPKYVPQIGNKLRPLFKSTVSGVYKLGQKTREAVAETRERVQDLVAEVSAEQAKPAAPAATVPAAAAAAEAA